MATTAKTPDALEAKPFLSDEKLKKILICLVVLFFLTWGALKLFVWVRNKITSESSSEENSSSIAQASASCLTAKFRIDRGEEVQTVPTIDATTGLECHYVAYSSERFIVLAPSQRDTSHIPYEAQKGISNWCGSRPQGQIRIRGQADGTKVEFRFIGLVRSDEPCQ